MSHDETSQHDGKEPVEQSAESSEPVGGVEGDLIPIPILGIVFATIWIVVVLLLSPGWSDQMRSLTARRQARAGNFESALGNYQILVKRNPDNPSFWGELAHTQAELGNHEEAIKNYRKATEVLLQQSRSRLRGDERGFVPPSPHHYAGEIGKSLFYLGELEEAKSMLQTYLTEVDRQHGQSHFYLGQIFIKQSNIEQAALHLNAARDSGFAEERIRPIIQGLVDELLPVELR